MEEKELYALFPNLKDREGRDVSEPPPNTHNMQPSIYTEFVAKRNASRIDHYFLNMRYGKIRIASLLVFAICFLAFLILLLIMLNESLSDFLKIHVEDTLISIQSHVISSLDSFTTEASFFSGFLADLFSTETPLLVLDKSNANVIVNLLNKCSNVAEKNIFWWDVGINEDGQLFGLTSFFHRGEDYTSFNYGTSDPDGEGLLKVWWVTNNTVPADFPDGEPDQTKSYNLFNREWYKQAEELNTSFWSRPIMEDGLLPFEPESRSILVSISTPINLNSTFLGAVANSIEIRSMQDVVRELAPSERSKIVLLDEAINVIAMNSQENPFTIWNDTIVLKDILSVEDPVWECAIESHGASQFACRVQDSTLIYYFGSHSLNMVGNQTWSLLTAICVNDFLTTAENAYFVNFALTMVLVLFSWAITALTIIIKNRKFSVMKSRIMNEPDDETKTMPLLSLYKYQISKIKRIQSHNTIIINTLKYIRKREHDMPTDQFYTPKNVLTSLGSNATVRDIIRYKFGILDSGEYSKVRIYRFYSADSTFSETVSRPQTVYTGNLFGGADSLVQPSIRKIQGESRNDQILFIAYVFSQINNGLLFNNEELEQTINNFLSRMDNFVLQLTADSFDLLYYILSNKLPNVLTSTDTALTTFTALLIWHLSMHSRVNEKQLRFKYFSHNSETRYIIGGDVLKLFKQTRKTEVLYDKKRWVNFEFDVTNLLHIFTPSQQLYNIRLFEKIASSREGSLSIREQHVLLCVLLSLSQFSFFFHKPTVAEPISLKLNSGILNPEIKEFEQNIKDEIISPAIRSLKSVMDSSFLDDLMH